MKKNSIKGTLGQQQRAEAKINRREKRRLVMLTQVDNRTKILTKGVAELQGKLSDMQQALEESYIKIATLTKENVNLLKLTEKDSEADLTPEENLEPKKVGVEGA